MNLDIAHLVQTYGPLGLLVTLLLCGLGLPVAKWLVIITGGVLAGTGRGEPVFLFVCCALGLHGGDFAIFLMGRRWGEGLLEHRWVRRFAPPHLLARARDLLARYGVGSILVARVVPFTRVACHLLLGSMGMRIPVHFAINLLASTVYCALFFALGYVVGDNPARIQELAASSRMVAALAVVAMALAFFMWRRHQAVNAAEVVRTED